MPAPIVDWITIVLAVLAALLLAVAIWWLWWRLPKQQADRLSLTIRDRKARADVEDNYRKNVGQVLVGVAAALFASAFTYLQFLQRDRELVQQAQEAHDTLMNNAFGKAFEQIASDKFLVRVAGIYALETVINGSELYQQPAVEALSAFVRDASKAQTEGPPAPDIRAALKVLARRGLIEPGLDLSGAHIPKTDLRGANLSGADLSGADLSNAFLLAANLRAANLRAANLTGAYLRDANLDGAYLHDANLTRADLTGADLTGADLIGANLTAANLTGAEIDQKQLDVACGSDVVLPKGLTQKLCPPQSSP
jgi:hypothetical protein